jgi:hypothetical protein
MSKKARRQVATSRPRFKVGDMVVFTFVNGQLEAKVIEDRGAIGFEGQRLYDLMFYEGGDEPRYIEMPEEELRAATEMERS